MPPLFDISERREVHGLVVLGLAGELDLSTVDALAARLRALAARKESVELDLSELDFLDSSGLRVLLAASDDARRDGWSLSIRRPPAHLWRVIEIAGVGACLPLVEG